METCPRCAWAWWEKTVWKITAGVAIVCGLVALSQQGSTNSAPICGSSVANASGQGYHIATAADGCVRPTVGR